MNGYEVTPGEVAAGFDGAITDATMGEFKDRLKAVRKMNEMIAVADVIRPGEPDVLEIEYARRYDFYLQVGRPPTDAEMAGLPVAGCAACARLGGSMPCDGHRRQMGAPLAYPPRPWPSDAPGHIPGTAVIARPGVRLPDYDVLRSVG